MGSKTGNGSYLAPLEPELAGTMLDVVHARRRAYSDFGVYGSTLTEDGHASCGPTLDVAYRHSLSSSHSRVVHFSPSHSPSSSFHGGGRNRSRSPSSAGSSRSPSKERRWSFTRSSRSASKERKGSKVESSRSPSKERRGSKSGSRSPSKERKESKDSRKKHAMENLAAYAFNLMVTVPHDISAAEGEEDHGRDRKLTQPDLLQCQKNYEADVSDHSDNGGLSIPEGGTCTVKSAPSTPQTEQRIVLPRPLPRHDTFIAPGIPLATALPLPSTGGHCQQHHAAVPQAYIPMKLKTTTFSKSNRHALKSLSRSTPAMSPSASPRHSDSEGVPRVSKATKKFMRHFASDAPKTERVLNYYSCALVADILLQGTLYITPNYFAFYSKIFGHVSRLLIPIVQVSVVQKERTAKIIPNAVGLQTLDGKSYVFGSLLSRDSTYKLMNHCWKKAQKLADSDSEPASQVNATPEKHNLVADDEEEDEEDESGSNSAEEDDSLNDEPDAAPSAPLPATPTIWVPGGTTISNTSTIASLTSQLSSTPTSTSPNSTSGGLKQPMLVASSPKLVEDMLRRSSTESNRNKLNTLKEEPGGGGANDVGVIDYITQACWRFGSVPVKLVSEGIKELWSLPRTSLLLIISTFMLVLLFASAAFMLYRVDTLSQQMTIQKQPSDYDIMYEEVLQMQQRLHNAASVEIERTLTNQLKLISTVRKSLEAMTVLLHNEPAGTPAQIPDAT